MSSTTHIDFWFTMGSTYTCLSVMRLPSTQAADGLTFRWRPFYLLSILREMNHVPFADKPAKCAYMWRDIERRAAIYGIPVRLPAPYPISSSGLANRIAWIGMREGWGQDYVRAAYCRWFQHGEMNGSEANTAASLGAIGQDMQRVLTLAEGPETDQALEAETVEARRLGIFGSPTFVVGHELYWGDDRLEEAIRWCRTGASTAPPAGGS